MIDMKITEQEKKEDSVVSSMDKSSYPYGLRIYLDPESVKKLGLKGCQVGEKYMLEASIEVMSVNAEVIKGDEKEISVSFQIKEMMIESPEQESAEEVIYK